jgi:2-polyprenyl-6-methoxyphenol hydroxylase-like FAD-dependent oxidoreductase
MPSRPTSGQGACLAIEDAVVLASAIDEHGIDDGLRIYDASRRPRTEAMARFSGRLGGILQSTSRAVVGIRDAITLAIPTPLFMRATGTAFAWMPPGETTPEPSDCR